MACHHSHHSLICVHLNKTDRITKFRGKYCFLSNFSFHSVELWGYLWPTAEHAYQAAKSTDRKHWIKILESSDPAIAKKIGRKAEVRIDWEVIKYARMYEIVREKFLQNPEIAVRLLETGDAYLEEGNTWGDRVWGVCDGKGENYLGLILMKVREELKYHEAFSR